LKFLKSLLLAATVALLCGQAQAWTAIAIGEEYSFIQYNSDTSQQAETEALTKCSAKASGCQLFGKTMNGTAVVLAKGDGGWGRASNLNPRIAANNALAQCREVSKNCRFESAVWDSGATWGAVAIGKDATFVQVNATTRIEAELDALKGCEKLVTTAGSCKIAPDFSFNRHVYYSFASSKDHSGLGREVTPEQAGRLAIESCDKGKAPGETCAITNVFENRGPTAEPIDMKQLVAEIEQAPRKTSKAPPVSPRYTTQQMCTNHCANGNCVRSFKDGRKDRWQAPYIFDPVTKVWTWDVTTNACGSL
jgi:Domain of unknown function (DUF4189)